MSGESPDCLSEKHGMSGESPDCLSEKHGMSGERPDCLSENSVVRDALFRCSDSHINIIRHRILVGRGSILII